MASGKKTVWERLREVLLADAPFASALTFT